MTDIPDINERILAVTTFDKNIVVTAGAGTGKTTLLVDRIIYLLMREPDPLKITEIVALTFTNKAANEMKIRLRDRLLCLTNPLLEAGEGHEGRILEDMMVRYRISRNKIAERASNAINDLEKAQICTMHSFAGYILRLYPIEAGVSPGFTEDEGPLFEEHFERKWTGWLDTELSMDSPNSALWEVVLERIKLESLKSFAREICREGVSINLLEQNINRPAISKVVMTWLKRRQISAEEILARYSKSNKTLKQLYNANEIFDEVLSGKDRSVTIEGISSSTPPSGWDEDDFIAAKQIIRAANRLIPDNNQFFINLLRLFIPFARECRKRFVLSGNISFDGLLTLCRDLLKSRPKVRQELKNRFKSILVDEFQDTDPVQYEIILYLSERPGTHEAEWRNIKIDKGKIFIVGDPKQSIYAFRKADIEAYAQVAEMIQTGQEGIRLDLSTSFRHHNAMIDVVNEVSGRIIKQREQYQPEYVGLKNHPDRKAVLPSHRVELRIINGQGDRDMDTSKAINLEAEAIGKWLKKEIIGIELIYDKKGSKEYVSPSHVAVLLRKLTNVNVYLEVLRRYDIPYIVEGERRFFAAQEVIDFVNLLKVIDDPFDRVSLVGVLRSPLGGLTDREIYELDRNSLLDYRISDSILQAGLKCFKGDNNIAAVISELYRLLKRLYHDAGVKPLSDAINHIFETLPVLELAASSSNGEQAMANLIKIRKIAESLSDKSDLTLRGFTARLEKNVLGMEEEGESPLAEEASGAVRIMSIHKAKGLEFPFVILAGMHTSPAGAEEDISVVHDWSTDEIGFKVDNLRNYASVMLYDKRRIRDEEEQKRLLYVAMTRAKECLVLSGTLYDRMKKGSFLYMIKDVIGDSLGEKNAGELIIGKGRIRQHVIGPDECAPEYGSRTGQKSDTWRRKGEKRFELNSFAGLWKSRSDRYDTILGRSLFVSPSRPGDGGAGLTLEKKLMSGEERGGREKALLIGTIVHSLLEQWDFRNDKPFSEDSIEEICTKLIPQQFISEIVYIKDEIKTILNDFLGSPAYDELKRVNIIGRETPFTILWNEQIMDGVIDLIYEDGDKLFLADYKTDRVSEAGIGERIKEYSLSGEIYKEAARRCLKRDINGFKLIFLRLGKSFDLKL